MRFNSQKANLILLRGSLRLTNLHTSTTKIVSTILSSLEQVTHVHIILDCETKVLKVHLPRLKLDFFLRKGATQLESMQFREMIVDLNQSIGILIELVNKLVFRSNIDSSRNVIVPYDDVRFESNSYHVRVHIDTFT